MLLIYTLMHMNTLQSIMETIFLPLVVQLGARLGLRRRLC
jgi:hypothetical protein